MNLPRSVLLGIVAATVIGPSSLSAERREVVVFNGKDLTGLTAFMSMRGDAANRPKVEDVDIVKEGGVLRMMGKPTGYLRTNDKYTNFSFTFDYRWVDSDPMTNKFSGLFLRMGLGENGGGDRRPAYQVEIANTKWPGSLSGDFWIHEYDDATFKTDEAFVDLFVHRSARGAYFKNRHRRAYKDAEKRLGEWNTMEVVCDKDHIVVKINGELVNEATGANVVAGYVAFQAENIEFRNIRLVVDDN